MTDGGPTQGDPVGRSAPTGLKSEARKLIRKSVEVNH